MAVAEDDNAPLLYRDSWLLGIDTSEHQVYNENNEPPDVKQARWRSIRIIYTVVFLNAICFTMMLPSLWTYLQVLDPGASTSQLGWTVAAFSLGQLIASPIFGAWANLRRSHKEPTAFSFTLAALSYTFYAYLASIPGPKKYYMIAARAMLGLSAGNVAVWRSYVASATTLKERTVTMANINICASAGFVLGPILQAAFVPISHPGPMEKDFLHINMYTIPALLAAVFSCLSALLLLVVFKEHRIKDEPGAEAASIQFLPSQKVSIDFVAVFTCILHFFSTAITFQIFQTLTTPLIMHNFAWNKAKATFIQGMVTGGISVLAIFIYFIVKILSKRVSERALLMTGFLFTAAACFVFVPFGQKLPPRGMAPIRPVNVSRSNSSPWIEYPYYTTTGAAYYHSQETTKIGDPFAKTSRSESNNFTSPPKENLSSNAKSEITWNNLPRIHTHMTDKMHRLPIRDSTINSKSSYQLPDVQREQDGRNNILKFVSVQLKPRHHWFSQLLNYFSSVQRSTIDSNTFQRHKQALPWNTETRNVRISPQAATSEDLTTTPVPVTTTSKESQDGEGCPWNLSWCAHVPVLHLAQYAVGTLLYGIGYPLCHVLTFAIFSKVLGSKPQGLWMGIFAASGSLAGIAGPVLISHVYDKWGPRVAFTGCTAFLMVVILYSFAVIHRLIPLSQRQKQMGPLTI
ncbi:hypothetical protein RRG08_008896 [Elysia crispata]|uniref:Major facilitator superfamily (MFS) profile domain-containing protein n=1 Tax=Elysia crispata TaxID=231223 RepID=A0AAE1DNG0_9GAST|nr:hypothetical protein RRG08_008896 [Elysia crispata]